MGGIFIKHMCSHVNKQLFPAYPNPSASSGRHRYQMTSLASTYSQAQETVTWSGARVKSWSASSSTRWYIRRNRKQWQDSRRTKVKGVVTSSKPGEKVKNKTCDMFTASLKKRRTTSLRTQRVSVAFPDGDRGANGVGRRASDLMSNSSDGQRADDEVAHHSQFLGSLTALASSPPTPSSTAVGWRLGATLISSSRSWTAWTFSQPGHSSTTMG